MDIDSFIAALEDVDGPPQEAMVSGSLNKPGFPLITVKRQAESTSSSATTSSTSSTSSNAQNDNNNSKKTTKKVKTINEVNLSLPIEEEKFDLASAFATQAPFGKGDKTLTDEKVRKTLEIQPSQVVFRNEKDWNDLVNDCVKNVAQAMSVTTQVKAEFYKMLLYKKGDHFKRHRDNAKVANMFASMVFVLPSVYSGGELVGYHNGKTMEYLKDGNEVSIRFAAWFCDVEHEIKPLISGQRIVLVYNLISISTNAPIPKMVTSRLQLNLEELNGMIDDWEEDEDGNEGVFIMKMEHQYTPEQQKLINAGRGDVLLKGVDAVVVNKIRKHLNERVVCFVCKVEKTNQYDGVGGHHNYYGYGYDSDDDEKAEVGDLLETEFDVRINDEISLDVEEEDTYGFDLEDDDDWSQDGDGEYCGNYAEPIERRYEETGLAIILRSSGNVPLQLEFDCLVESKEEVEAFITAKQASPAKLDNAQFIRLYDLVVKFKVSVSVLNMFIQGYEKHFSYLQLKHLIGLYETELTMDDKLAIFKSIMKSKSTLFAYLCNDVSAEWVNEELMGRYLAQVPYVVNPVLNWPTFLNKIAAFKGNESNDEKTKLMKQACGKVLVPSSMLISWQEKKMIDEQDVLVCLGLNGNRMFRYFEYLNLKKTSLPNGLFTQLIGHLKLIKENKEGRKYWLELLPFLDNCNGSATEVEEVISNNKDVLNQYEFVQLFDLALKSNVSSLVLKKMIIEPIYLSLISYSQMKQVFNACKTEISKEEEVKAVKKIWDGKNGFLFVDLCTDASAEWVNDDFFVKLIEDLTPVVVEVQTIKWGALFARVGAMKDATIQTSLMKQLCRKTLVPLNFLISWEEKKLIGDEDVLVCLGLNNLIMERGYLYLDAKKTTSTTVNGLLLQMIQFFQSNDGGKNGVFVGNWKKLLFTLMKFNMDTKDLMAFIFNTTSSSDESKKVEALRTIVFEASSFPKELPTYLNAAVAKNKASIQSLTSSIQSFPNLPLLNCTCMHCLKVNNFLNSESKYDVFHNYKKDRVHLFKQIKNTNVGWYDWSEETGRMKVWKTCKQNEKVNYEKALKSAMEMQKELNVCVEKFREKEPSSSSSSSNLISSSSSSSSNLISSSSNLIASSSSSSNAIPSSQKQKKPIKKQNNASSSSSSSSSSKPPTVIDLSFD